MVERILDWVERNFLKAVALSIFALVLLLCMVVYNVGNATGRASLEKRDYGRSLMPLVVTTAKPLLRAALPVNIGNSAGDPLFIDTFNYTVDRADDGGIASGGAARTAFQNAGWYAVKRNPTDINAGGYLYTTTSITGYAGTMPGLSGSGRVLCIEARPSVALAGAGINQSDFYLQYGAPGSVHIPANVWYQFWFYINDYGAEQSRFSDGSKLFYPAPPDDDYSVAYGNLPYLLTLGTSSYETDGSALQTLSYGSSQYVQNQPQEQADFSGASEYPTNADKLGSNLISASTGYLEANKWYLIKLHFDNSGTQGTYEMWMREMSQAFTKRAEWVGGVTADFDFPTVVGHRSGMASLRIPTTFGKANSDPTNYDSYMYMSDFAFADTEADLPTYGSY